MFVEYLDGYYLEDDKTTSSLGASWTNQWELRSQFSGYCWAAKKVLDVPVKGMIVRGVSILKTRYDTVQTITYRADWELERWYEQLLRDLARLESMWKGGYYDYNLDYACNEYGGCQFRDICKSNRPESWLEAEFIPMVWNPIDREMVSVEDWENSWKVQSLINQGE